MISIILARLVSVIILGFRAHIIMYSNVKVLLDFLGFLFSLKKERVRYTENLTYKSILYER